MDKASYRPEKQALEWIEGDMPYSTAFGDHFYCREDGRAECGHVFLAGNGLPGRWGMGEFRIGELGFGTGLNFCETWRVWRERCASQSLAERGGNTPQPLPTRGRGFEVQESTVQEHAAIPPGEVDNPEPLPLVGRGWGGESFLPTLEAERPKLHFTSFELYPMNRADIDKALTRWPEIDAERQALVAAWPAEPKDEVRLELAEDVTLTVLCGDAMNSLSASRLMFDAWFLDGFAPSRNPAMWSDELMQAVFDHTRQGGTFATYAAAGFVRRNLVAAGFAVERRPGFAGKREMLCGTRPD